MKKSLVFLIVAAALGVLLANERPHPETNNKISQSINNDSSQTKTVSTDNTQTTTNNVMKDGTFLGSVEKNEYEIVQVEIKVSSSKITEINVPVLDYTIGGRSERVVENALPILKKDAIKKQSSKIDYVSGATLISMSFADSLETAIINAKK